MHRSGLGRAGRENGAQEILREIDERRLKGEKVGERAMGRNEKERERERELREREKREREE